MISLQPSASSLQPVTKPWPEEIDEWTHFLHDASGNALARDSVVGPPRHLQWVAKPLYCRSHETDSSVSGLVSGGGRIFYILDEGLTGIIDPRLPPRWSLVARDAFSGVLLWKEPLPEWGWRQWKQQTLDGKDWSRVGGARLSSPVVLPRRLVATDDRLYVTLGFRAPLSVLDAATGQQLETLPATEGTDEILFTDGILVLCIRDIPATGIARGLGKAPRESVIAVRADTSELLWKQEVERVLPLSLAAKGNRVFFHTHDELVGVDLHTGRELWKAECAADGGGRQADWSIGNTLVAQDEVVLLLGARGLQAFSAETGDVLWTARSWPGFGAGSPPDLFVASGLVWHGGLQHNYNMRDPKNVLINGLEETVVRKEGRDLVTGEVKKTVTARNLIDFGHHPRCHRSKATEQYLLLSKRGVEFLDLQGDGHARCDWLRFPCRQGGMPSGGLLYVPPHQCFCYPGVLLNGFNALAPARKEGEGVEGQADPTPRLHRGPAYRVTDADTSSPASISSDDWPTYRYDAKRSGSTQSKVPATLEIAWDAEIDGDLSPPVVADGKVFVASKERHTIHSLNADNGDRLWSFTAGGRIVSPPTYSKGLVLFGSVDGCVYSLRASDGALVWRFRAAPSDRRVVMFSQVTSAWPVHGSVLVDEGVAYFAAGRSSFLDGGIYVFGVDVASGEKLYETRLEGPIPDLPNDPGWAFDMEGARTEVLVSQGDSIYMRQIRFDKQLNIQKSPRITRLGDRQTGLHLFSTSSLLDDSWYNRTFWMYSTRWPGYYRANKASKCGQILVFSDNTTYGVKVYDQERTKRPWFEPGTGYQLFADSSDNEPMLEERAENWDKGPGFTRGRSPLWTKKIPIRARAFLLAGDTLFVAGPPDVIDAMDPLAAFEGRKGGKLWALAADDGKELVRYELKSPPVLDGLIAARGRLYLCTTAGRILCYAGE